MNQNFHLIKKDIDTKPFLEELTNFLELGNTWSTIRSKVIDVQKETKNIEIVSIALPKEMTQGLNQREITTIAADCEYHELCTKIYPHFQYTYSFIEKWADENKGQITRLMIVSLAPYSQVYKHIDSGKYYIGKNRYHIPLKTKGSLNVCGDEKQFYHEGELWWFDNKKPHEAFNEDSEERIHLIFDILPKKRSLLRKIRDYLSKKLAIMLLTEKSGLLYSKMK